ncbi:MAG TPA: hypothetical protein VF384_12120 [Planctomycetota bacterium]
MTRPDGRVATAAVFVLTVAACTANMRSRIADGHAHLAWEPIAVPADATDVRYEVEIHKAEQGLPTASVRLVPRLEQREFDAGHLPAGDYVWSVRARYWRRDHEWVTRWLTLPNTPAVALEPQRGFCPLTID